MRAVLTTVELHPTVSVRCVIIDLIFSEILLLFYSFRHQGGDMSRVFVNLIAFTVELALRVYTTCDSHPIVGVVVYSNKTSLDSLVVEKLNTRHTSPLAQVFSFLGAPKNCCSVSTVWGQDIYVRLSFDPRPCSAMACDTTWLARGNVFKRRSKGS